MAILSAYIFPHPPLILPEIGRGQERAVSDTTAAMRLACAQIAEQAPDVVIVASPHTTLYADYFHISPGKSASGALKRFGSHVVTEAEYDVELVDAITRIARETGIYAGTDGARDESLDHATLIPLRFLCEAYGLGALDSPAQPMKLPMKLVRIGLSGMSPLDHYRFGKCIAQAVKHLGRRAVFVASGDLSHKLKADGPYGASKEGPEFDARVTDIMASGNFDGFLNFEEAFCENAAECGLRAFQIMAGALDATAVDAKLFSYEGPYGVGYAVASFMNAGCDESRRFDVAYVKREADRLSAIKAEEDALVKLARISLESYVRTGVRIRPPDALPDALLHTRAGAFVSLKKAGRLRGCIGTISPVAPTLAEEIIRNAVSAGCEDPRFPPVTPDELATLVYSVDVLSEPEPISSEAELDAKRYGVIVTSGYRRGLLLPNIEGVNTVREQVDIAKSKAGIGPGEKVALMRFEVVRHR